MKVFRAPLEDILFSLNHVADAPQLPGWDADFASEIVGHFSTFMEAEIAPLNTAGDQQGCRLEAGRVLMPDGFAEAYQNYSEQGWSSLTVPDEYGGQGLGSVMLAATSEIFSGANHALQMVLGLVPGAVSALLNFGTDAQKQKYIPQLASGSMLATMCLTESGAGSDLSRIRCKAEQTENGWRINGEKIFISGGDQNLSEQILHLVLARTSDEGIKGLSLFLCTAISNDGTRNEISVTRLEEKMGLHASPTCQLSFDNAEAELLGKEGEGLSAMFKMMNHARADVALQGVAHAARACDIAKSYASERVQGRGPDGQSVKLSAHADVRRMVDEIDGLAISARAIAHLAFVKMEANDAPELLQYLTPLAKAYGTDAGIKAAQLGMQVLGGYGYLNEYFIEQIYRDARITSIYEGANGIHERMLATRLLNTAPADAFEEYLTEKSIGVPHMERALDAWRSARVHLLSYSDPTALAHDFYLLTADTLLSAIWHKIDRLADNHSDPDRLRRLANLNVSKIRNMQVARMKLLGMDVRYS